MRSWLCSQFGAREKYAIPRALFSEEKLYRLYTDLWMKPASPLRLVNKRAAGRYHPSLANADVRGFNITSIYYNIRGKLGSPVEIDHEYDRMLSKQIPGQRSHADIFFGYSYSSRMSMKVAKSNGFTTILGQINPGPAEAAIVTEEYRKYEGGQYQPFVPDEEYWDRWREETGYADHIIVNSEWSKKLLMEDGVKEEKLIEIPLCFEEPVSIVNRDFPSAFSKQRPLRLLYLGGIELRKGFHLLKDAMRELINAPVQLDVVGGLKAPKVVIENLPSNISYHSSVAPHEVGKFYNNTDAFIFPTLSDGFGLTLLEAQAHKLPVICSQFCARVIADDVNGKVLREVSSAGIVDAVVSLLDNPRVLELYSRQSIDMSNFSVAMLAARLNNLVP